MSQATLQLQLADRIVDPSGGEWEVCGLDRVAAETSLRSTNPQTTQRPRTLHELSLPDGWRFA